jgi:hypothetical protein
LFSRVGQSGWARSQKCFLSGYFNGNKCTALCAKHAISNVENYHDEQNQFVFLPYFRHIHAKIFREWNVFPKTIIPACIFGGYWLTVHIHPSK